MFLFNYNDPSNKPLYRGQKAIQILLVLIALACVPCMLIVKTLVLRRQHLWRKNLGTENFAGIRVGNGPTEDEAEIIQHDQLSQQYDDEPEAREEEEFIFADVAVHQAIHTIEYCLGCISNTASYLRLWALSLAHAQLSEVLWSMVMHIGLSTRSLAGFILLAIVFYFFAVLTVGHSSHYGRPVSLLTCTATALGGVPKQVLLGPGLQVPPLHLRQHPGWKVRGLRSADCFIY
ncbi:V-type proton ATPase 116 kDa subunit a isoform 1 [Larimichthys crocea]|uniref:Uncharacterized protein n=1 Tax=Larimichthys crocea TaxID=215358 RepID=A0ACD3R694_LARCR|nr:V-type proton ATPase 116 kDa subunit a isoform 1 [Larimichthys crocea]